MIEVVTILVVAVVCTVMGAFALLGYVLHRMMGNDGWDDSNITNALRVLSHVTMHAEDFGKMYYLTDQQKSIIMETMVYPANAPRRPFWYVDKDELSEVVNTRP